MMGLSALRSLPGRWKWHKRRLRESDEEASARMSKSRRRDTWTRYRVVSENR